jgi:hypothetical protein
MPPTERFIRFPTACLEALLREPLSGAQWRIITWVIRRTWGWNRESTSFSWYRIAKDLGIDRAATYRAGQALLAGHLLRVDGQELAIQVDPTAWTAPFHRSGSQLPLPGTDVAFRQPKALPRSNASVAAKPLTRCLEATLSRRAKDSSKDRLKTYKDTCPTGAAASRRQSSRRPLKGQRQAVSGRAGLIPGKYDGLSEN